MSVRTITSSGGGITALYDSTSGIAFGPTFTGDDSLDQAAHFLDWLNDDAREYDPRELSNHHARWAAEFIDENGLLTPTAFQRVLEIS